MLMFLWALAFPAGAAPALTAALDRETIQLGETAVLSLTFEGGSPDAVPAVPSQPNLSVSYGGQSSQFTIVNGQATSSVTYSFRLTPTQIGEFTIPAVRAAVGGQTLASRPLKLRVLRQQAPPAPGQPENRLAFLKLIVPKNSVYLGEVFPVEIQLFVQSAQDLQMPKLNADGFTLGTFQKPAQTRTHLGNVIYNVVIFKVAATPVKTGRLMLGPADCSLVLRVPQGNRRGQDPFDIFNDVFGGRTELRPVTLRSNAEEIEVLPLPEENKPADFAGAVGSFSLAVSASPTNVIAGDPVTLKIQIAGQGAFDSLSLPSQSDWREFKIYPPNSNFEATDTLGIEGVKSFEQVVIPENSEVRQIPPIHFSFFDPNQKSYRQVTHGAIPLKVGASSGGQAQPTVLAGAKTSSAPPPTRDIVHIKPHFGAASPWPQPLVQQTWFLALQGIPLLAWLSLVVWRKRQEALDRNPGLRRRLHVSRLVRAGLRELREHAAGKKNDEFFATVFRLLQEELGAKLDLPASAITEAVVDERLKNQGAPDELTHALHELFALCNQARYAPQRTTQELMSIVPQVEAALTELMEFKEEKPA